MGFLSCCLCGVDWALRATGLACCGGGCYTYCRIKASMNGKCDTATRKAKLPPDAYKDKVVWITGASSGIGEELAKQFAKNGAKLILSARSKDKLESLAAELRKGTEVQILQVDLKELPSLQAKAKEALTFFGAIDILVNNGGYSSRALAFLTPDLQTDIDMMQVNFLSAVALTKALLPHFHERKTGHIINMSSVSGKLGGPLRTLYCGAKFAMIGWFDALRVEELGFKTGVFVTNVCPGSVKTDVAKNAVTGDGGKFAKDDPAIANGLDVEWTCQKILAGAYNKQYEVWIAGPQEMQLLYINQLAPDTLKTKMSEAVIPYITFLLGKDYVQGAQEKLGQK